MSPAQHRRRRWDKGESRPKKRKGAGRRTTVHDLPEHVFEQILFRLGPYSPYLVRAAATCRRWFRVVADAGFLARLATTTHAGDYRTIDGCSVFIPSSPLDDDGRRRFSLDFLPDSESWGLADSRDSLLLLSKKESAYESCSLEHNYDSCRCCDVVVCDPLRARYQVIPWPPGEDRSECIGMFLADGGNGHPSSMSSFKIIVVFQQTVVSAYTTGIDSVWHSIHEEFPDDPESITGDFFVGRANGSLYWGLEEDITMVIVLDEATWTLSLARLPWGLSSDKTARIIGGQDGMLRVVRLIGKNLYVFAQTRLGCNGDNREWVLEKWLCLSKATVGLPGRDESLLKQKIVIIRANDEYILLSLSDGTWAFTVELDTMRVESEHPRNKYTGKVYPYVLPWPPVLSDLSKEQYAVVRRHKCDRK
ncbi:hypothetical protein QYE76_015276 [Lolium multiflorum]|uniref:F-box domain-containing protein n=1 Tax=Lolium multiflorum TaxID=4521 RepID=A0AAD8U7U9_LOLMU|nr:hypothetical protein QYE76_015276 [Lolium multiflorum]